MFFFDIDILPALGVQSFSFGHRLLGEQSPEPIWIEFAGIYILSQRRLMKTSQLILKSG